jgi:hypothetical protein
MTDSDMVENRKRIETLKATPPAVIRHRRARTLAIARDACAVIALIAFGVALWANHQSSKVGTCVNNILGTRNGANSNQLQADIDKALADQKALEEIGSDPAKGFADYKAATSTYVHSLEAVAAYRIAHPLGTC